MVSLDSYRNVYFSRSMQYKTRLKGQKCYKVASEINIKFDELLSKIDNVLQKGEFKLTMSAEYA